MTTQEKKTALMDLPSEYLLQIGLPQMTFYREGNRLLALCPFHSDRKLGNFSYNLSRDVWKCFVCGHGGSGPFSLIMGVNGWDFRTTVNFLFEHRDTPVAGISATAPVSLMPSHKVKVKNNGYHSPSGTRFTPPTEGEVYPGYCENLSSKEKSAIYECFAKTFPMPEKMSHQLCKKRGLWYRSMSHFFLFPSPAYSSTITKLHEALDKVSDGGLYNKLLGTPGFFWNKEQGRPGFIGYEGSLGILNHDVDGLVNGIEMRLKPSVSNGVRYMPFSSDGICSRYPERFCDGTRLGAIVDVVYKTFPDGECRGIAITEGKFKALHLSYLGYDVLNIHGIANWRSVLPVLEQLKKRVEKGNSITIVFDADCRSNPPVARHAAALGEELISLGYDVSYLTWPKSYGKGVDDVVNNHHAKSLKSVPADAFLETTLLPFIARAEKQGQ